MYYFDVQRDTAYWPSITQVCPISSASDVGSVFLSQRLSSLAGMRNYRATVLLKFVIRQEGGYCRLPCIILCCLEEAGQMPL